MFGRAELARMRRATRSRYGETSRVAGLTMGHSASIDRSIRSIHSVTSIERTRATKTTSPGIFPGLVDYRMTDNFRP